MTLVPFTGRDTSGPDARVNAHLPGVILRLPERGGPRATWQPGRIGAGLAP